MRALRVLWAAPWSLVGMILGLFFDRRRVTRGVVLCEGARWPRRLGWRYRALALGHVVLCVDEIDDAVFAHELAHVAQYERWGPFLVPAYALAGAWTIARGRRGYADNPFELAARRAAAGTEART